MCSVRFSEKGASISSNSAISSVFVPMMQNAFYELRSKILIFRYRCFLKWLTLGNIQVDSTGNT